MLQSDTIHPTIGSLATLITKLVLLLALAGCAHFQRMGEDLDFVGTSGT